MVKDSFGADIPEATDQPVKVDQPVTIEFLNALAKAAVNATTAMDGLTYAMKRQDRLSPPWSLLGIAFGLGGLITFLLLSVR